MGLNEVTRWLLDGDPGVAWQVQRDLLDRAPSTWKATRRRVATEGWGARLLALRAEDGSWGGGLYSPKWTGTFYTMRVLMYLGLEPNHPEGSASCRMLLRQGVTDSGAVTLWNSRTTDTCVTGMLLSMACHFDLAGDPRTRRMVDWLVTQQMHDGGWNCRKPRGAKHASFHTTISVLEGLAAFERSVGDAPVLAVADAGREYFLDHQLYRSARTGEVVKPSFTRFSFPPRWYFDVLRGLEHFAAVDAPWDDRLADAMAVVVSRRSADGRWKSKNRHSGKTHFVLEPGRTPSRVNTLRALRVVRWAGLRAR